MKRAAALATLAFLAWCALLIINAEKGWTMSNVTPTSDGLLAGALRAADAYWAAQGYPARCAPLVYLYDEHEDPDVAARGDVGGCEVYFDRRWYAGLRENMVYGGLAYTNALATLCSMAAHERGHNLGFGHDGPGPMAVPVANLPACWSWAGAETRSMIARGRVAHVRGSRVRYVTLDIPTRRQYRDSTHQ